MPYLQRLLYFILNFLWIVIGNCFTRERHKRIPLSQIDTIILNRADRLGDAAISLPFIQVFGEYLQSIQWKGTLRILASSYNAEILRPLEEIPCVDFVVLPSNEMHAYDRSWKKTVSLILLFSRKYAFRLKSKIRDCAVFVDFIDSVSEMMISEFPHYANAHWISANR